MQPYVAVVGDLADDESWGVDAARDKASRSRSVSASDEDEIAESVALPASIGGDDGSGGAALVTGRRVER